MNSYKNRLITVLKRRKIWLGIVASVLFFGLYINGGSTSKLKYNSPDETANAFWANNFAQTNSFRVAQPHSDLSEGLLRPRGMKTFQGHLVPNGWLGLPLYYGLIIKVTGSGALPYLTPALVILAGWFMASWISRLFGSRLGLLAQLLFYCQPVLWFYSSRGLWPNGLFVASLVIAWASLDRWLRQKRWFDALIAGASLGIALAARTSELWWVLAGLLVYALILRQRWHWPTALIGGAALALICVPVIWFNQKTYGGWLSNGYAIADSATQSLASADAPESGLTLSSLGQSMFPFGLNLTSASSLANRYLLFYLAPWIVPGWLGLVVVLRKKYLGLDRAALALAVSSLLITTWLILLYGSYSFSEYPDRAQLLFGSSYLRYWLPLGVLAVPFTAVFIHWLATQLGRGIYYRSIGYGLVLGLVVFSVYKIYQDPLYGLNKTVPEQRAEIGNLESVKKLTTESAILFAGDRDKLYWPERQVVGYNSFAPQYQRIASRLAQVVPVYLISKGEPEISYANRLASQRADYWELTEELAAGYRLYRLQSID